MKKKILLGVLASLCLIFRAAAQSTPNNNPGITITGKITDEHDNPLPGATLQIAGSKIYAASNQDGQFTIYTSIKKGSLLVSFIGYQSTQVAYDDLHDK